MSRRIVSILLCWFLYACAGQTPLVETGAVDSGSQSLSEINQVPAPVAPPGQTPNQAEGTVPSQTAYGHVGEGMIKRLYGVRFDNESSFSSWHDIIRQLVFSKNPTLTDGKILKIGSEDNPLKENECPECAGRLVRVVYCGVLTDAQMKDALGDKYRNMGVPIFVQFLRSWFWEDHRGLNACDPKYQDFPVDGDGKVSFKGLFMEVSGLYVFNLLPPMQEDEIKSLGEMALDELQTFDSQDQLWANFNFDNVNFLRGIQAARPSQVREMPQNMILIFK